MSTDLERQPDPTPLEHALGRAALDLAARARAVNEFDGPKTGEAFEVAVTQWRAAYRTLLDIAARYDGADS